MTTNVQEVIDNAISRKVYKQALTIYLQHAFPDDEGTQKSKLAWLDNPMFFRGGIPREARFGCYANGHMKLRCGYLNSDYNAEAGFWVDTNDGEDDRDTRWLCREIKNEVQEAWVKASIPIRGGRQMENDGRKICINSQCSSKLSNGKCGEHGYCGFQREPQPHDRGGEVDE